MLLYLQSVKALNDALIVQRDSLRSTASNVDYKTNAHSGKLKCAILLLLLSGNVQPNLGPMQNVVTPADFKNRAGLGFAHFNVKSS